MPGKAVLGATSQGPRVYFSVTYLACRFVFVWGDWGLFKGETTRSGWLWMKTKSRWSEGTAHTRLNTHNITGFFSYCGKQL